MNCKHCNGGVNPISYDHLLYMDEKGSYEFFDLLELFGASLRILDNTSGHVHKTIVLEDGRVGIGDRGYAALAEIFPVES